MNALKVIAYIAAAILIFFGVLFIYATFSPTVKSVVNHRCN
jgi:putative Mn2+ efflux pump MntP